MLCIVITGCVTQKERIERAQRLAAELEESKDVIKTIEIFNQFYDKECFTYKKDWCDKEILQELAKPQVDLGCMYKTWATDTYYNSDKCVLQRRANPLTETNFFDYKRFLPKNNNIKSDKHWLTLVEFYEDTHYCDPLDKELTTYEIKDCKEKHNQNTVNLAISQPKANCKDVYGTSFIDEIPYIVGDYPCDDIEPVIKAWGEAHMCNISGWQTGERPPALLHPY